MESLVIIGTGAMARDVTAFVNRYYLFNIIGYACSRYYLSEERQYLEKPIHAIDELEDYYDKTQVKLFVAISELRHLNRERKDVFTELKKHGWHFATLISPMSILWTTDIGEGCWIMDQAILGCEVTIGENTFISERAIVAHYSHIGSHSFIAIEGLILGSVYVGNQCFIGARAEIYNDLHVGNKCLIGAGCIIKNDIEDYTVCKIHQNIEVKQYSEKEIEEKLLPASEYKNKYNSIQK